MPSPSSPTRSPSPSSAAAAANQTARTISPPSAPSTFASPMPRSTSTLTSGSDKTTWLREIAIAPMAPADLDEVLVIERHSFPSAWSRSSYERELRNHNSYYFAARHEGRLVGYIGMWVGVDEGHNHTPPLPPPPPPQR